MELKYIKLLKTILPHDMNDLIKEHKPYVTMIKNMQSKFNDSNENPLFDDRNIQYFNLEYLVQKGDKVLWVG